MRIPVFILLSLGLAATAAAQTTTSWSYDGRTGPMVWGKLDPAYHACAKGHEQSPIDIRHAHLNAALHPIRFHFIAGPVTLENTGHTVEVHVNPGSSMVADGVRYELVQFHFHHPGEEAVKGALPDMNIHLVFKSAEGKLAVVAVRLNEDRGFPNPTLATLWEHLPATAGATEKVTDVVDPGGLLPTSRSYWTYTGSLTAPPCTEGVRWFIFEQEVSISRNQLQTFGKLYPFNARPLQEPHDRRIEASE
jgi:carbonic anhydrase